MKWLYISQIEMKLFEVTQNWMRMLHLARIWMELLHLAQSWFSLLEFTQIFQFMETFVTSSKTILYIIHIRRIKLSHISQPIMPKVRVETLENVEDEECYNFILLKCPTTDKEF